MVDQCAFDIRERAMSYAVQTAELGEDPLRILARAQLYAEFILSPDFGNDGPKLTDNVALAMADANQLSLDITKRVSDSL